MYERFGVRYTSRGNRAKYSRAEKRSAFRHKAGVTTNAFASHLIQRAIHQNAY